MWEPWLRNDGKWEFVVIEDGKIIQASGIKSEDIEFIYSCANYVNKSVIDKKLSYMFEKNDFFKAELDYIKAQGKNYGKKHIKLELI